MASPVSFLENHVIPTDLRVYTKYIRDAYAYLVYLENKPDVTIPEDIQARKCYADVMVVLERFIHLIEVHKCVLPGLSDDAPELAERLTDMIKNIGKNSNTA